MKSQLFVAAESGNISKFRSALLDGHDINERDENGMTPLMVACKFGNTELVKFMTKKGAELDLVDENGGTAALYARISNKPELINLFQDSEGSYQTESNPSIQEGFQKLFNNILPVITELHPIVKKYSDKQKDALFNDLINIILLLRHKDTPTLYDGYCLGLFILSFADNQSLSQVTDKINSMTIQQKMDYAKEALGWTANYDYNNRSITKANFELEGTKIIGKLEADKFSKAFYSFAQSLLSQNEVTENAQSAMNFLNKYLFREKAISAEKDKASEKSVDRLESILSQLDQLVGMDNIKNDVYSLINIIKANKRRQQEGLPVQSVSLHSVFIGPPGTGKTTIARILSEIYYTLEILPDKNFVETDRSGLVAGYVGQTAIKTDNLITQALNGVLFIDEAYALKRRDSNDEYGQEAIDILLKRMEDFRDKLIIIVAGYEDEMSVFINSNPGLKSRFNRYFYFKDFNSDELTEIYKRLADKSGYFLKENALIKVKRVLDYQYSKRDNKFGNARLVRNLFEKTFERQANRTASIENYTREILTTIEDIDIPDEYIALN